MDWIPIISTSGTRRNLNVRFLTTSWFEMTEMDGGQTIIRGRDPLEQVKMVFRTIFLNKIRTNVLIFTSTAFTLGCFSRQFNCHAERSDTCAARKCSEHLYQWM